MNPAFLGDSYDLVKRVFVQELRQLGYEIEVDPLFTGDWASGQRETFHRLIGTPDRKRSAAEIGRRALFIDPDTGVRRNPSPRHVSFGRLAEEATRVCLVFAFDQSFSRQGSAKDAMQAKLEALRQLHLHGLYYDSHARFLFVSQKRERVVELRHHLHQVGIPACRLVTYDI